MFPTLCFTFPWLFLQCTLILLGNDVTIMSSNHYMSPQELEAKMYRLLRVKKTINKNYRSITLFPIGLSQEILPIWLKNKGCQQFRSQTQGNAKILSPPYNWNVKLPHHRNNAEAQMWNARCCRILTIPREPKMDFQSSHLQVSFALAHFGKNSKFLFLRGQTLFSFLLPGSYHILEIYHISKWIN